MGQLSRPEGHVSVQSPSPVGCATNRVGALLHSLGVLSCVVGGLGPHFCSIIWGRLFLAAGLPLFMASCLGERGVCPRASALGH